jgi:hypothetical protein
MWRHWFAAQLGFSYIPGGAWDEPTTLNRSLNCQLSLSNPEAVRGWLRSKGIQQQQLAVAIGWHYKRVNHLLTGRRQWSTDFQTAVEHYVARHFEPS